MWNRYTWKRSCFWGRFSGHSIVSTMPNLREFLRSLRSRIFQPTVCTQITTNFLYLSVLYKTKPISAVWTKNLITRKLVKTRLYSEDLIVSIICGETYEGKHEQNLLSNPDVLDHQSHWHTATKQVPPEWNCRNRALTLNMKEMATSRMADSLSRWL